MSRSKLFIKIGLLGSILLMSGCATTHSTPGDPLEGYNRAMYQFNDVLDKVVMKPVAKGYDTVVPTPIHQGISNFFSNLDDFTVAINDLLQGKFKQAGQDAGRFILNSTVGVAGIFDVASLSGYNKHDEDFGQTLGKWGAGPGAYIVLPFFGPRDVRDTFGMVGDYYTDPVTYVHGPGARNALYITRIIDNRASLLKTEKVLDAAALDKYSYIRDAYLQRRRSLVYDGHPPNDDNFDPLAE